MKQLIGAIMLCIVCNLQAQNFNDFFYNKTLRVDYIFAGNDSTQNIYVDELASLPTWAGRRNNLCELPLEGNGQIIMRDQATGECIYKTSFSSLFQEWIATEEAEQTSKSFENTFLLPYPKQPVEVEITLLSSARKPITNMKHKISPDDILIHEKGTSHITPYKYIVKSGNEEECIDVAILAEGYTENEMDLFYKDAERTSESIFHFEPFKSMKSKFNIIAVASPSTDSGVSVPRNNNWKNNAFNSHFDTFYSERYLTTSRVKAIHDALAGIPYEHIIIIANTDTYGGGGIYNSYTLTAAHHDTFTPVLAHEFGHSFGGLGDEYFYDGDVMEDFYPQDVEPWEQNISTLVDFSSKWQDMLKDETPQPTPIIDHDKYAIGVYEGGGYSAKGVYRPAYNCRMRTNEYPEFCPVCQRALQRIIDFYTKK